MRKAYFLLLLVPAAVIYACGGTSDNDDGGADATSDTTNNKDSSADGGSGDTGSDGNTNDGGSNDATMDVVINITCLYPYQCVDGGSPDAAYPPSNSDDVCCGTLGSTGTFPFCSFTSLTTSCAAPGSCASALDESNCGTSTIRGCKHAAECTEVGYTSCCLLVEGDAGAQFCVPDEAKGFAKYCIDAGQ
jgi:hypothetical protein